jgi:DNA-binding CsgD family transcriptional regulator
MGRREEAMDVLEGALAGLGDHDPRLLVRLELEVLATTRRDVRLQARADDRVARLRALAGGEGGALPDPVQRVLLAALAFDSVLQQPAATVGDLARRALGDGQLLAEQGPESPALSLAVIALWMSEDLAGARSALDAALEVARRQGSVMGFVMLSCWRSHVAWRAGDLALAEADAANALEVGLELSLPPAVAYATASLGDALLDRGDVEGAALLLDQPLLPLVPAGGDQDQPLLFFRGRLRAAQGRAAEALADLELCGAGLAAFGATTPVIPWRGEAALAARDAGREDEASRLAAEAVEVARSFGAPGALGAATRAAGVVGGDDALLAEAVDLLAQSPCRLEHAKALADLGNAHRRAGRAEAARAALREGLDLADDCGAVALADALRGGLVALGARPRRRRTSGPAALTPSELRVAALAAEGHTNREIAQALFVTVRTVEMHLSNTYGKLGVPGRRGLAAALQAP